MSLKTKLTSLITTFVLLCSLLTVGVFAVKNTTFNVGGDIVFNVQGIEAEVKLESLKNASLIAPQTLENKMLAFELNNDMTASQVQACYESWAGLDLQFDSEEDVTLEIRITNTTQIVDNYLKVDLNAPQVTANNCTLSTDKATATIAPGGYEIFTLTFAVTDKEYSANIDGFDVNVSMQKVKAPTTLEVKYDPYNNYYYIEMGTYNEQPVRWRYVSDVTNSAVENGSSIGNATKFDPSAENKPNSATGARGMFILETQTFSQTEIDNAINEGIDYQKDGIVKFLKTDKYEKNANDKTYYHSTAGFESVLANDYSLSDIRAFLNGRNDITNNSVGNFLDVINIDENDAVYQKIEARSLQDLYYKMGVGEDDTAIDLPLNSLADNSVSDKLWLLSAYEAHKFLAGKQLADGDKISNDDVDDLAWTNDGLFGFAFYWLRGYLSKKPFGYCDLSVGDPNEELGGGAIGGMPIDFSYVAARPAFILNF